jgi:hypothetical protein
MGVEEAPTASTVPSMGVEEVSASPLEDNMVCVVGVEEPPLASVGVNIHASAPGRAEDSGFSSQTWISSFGRWRDINRKWFAIGLVFVVIALAIGLTVPLLYQQQVDNPCIICPNGATAGNDFVPNAFNGNLLTCLELINSSMDYESGSEMCSLSSVYKLLCCATPPAPTPVFDVIVPVPTETPTETPTVDTTPAPTPVPTDDTPTVLDNTCIICPNGTNAGGDFAPYADDGDLRTCLDLIDEAKLHEKGSDDCGWSELHELYCCFTAPEDPCIICPDGATAGDDYVPEYAGNSVTRATCKDIIELAKRFESDSDACGLYDIDVAYCCPSEVGNKCIICPDGTAIGDFSPYAKDGDSRTCADLIEEAKLHEVGSDDCAMSEVDEINCCFTTPENPCIICPNGATAGDDYVPEIEGNTSACSEVIQSAQLLESESDACRLASIFTAYCCPP